MTAGSSRCAAADDLIHVVLDEASADRLRSAAAKRGIGIDELVLEVLYVASQRDGDLAAEPAERASHSDA